jgi:hypothetical protein
MLALAESKGINIGRVFNTLGFADYRCISVVGGGIGNIIRDSVAREGINSLYYEIDGDNRVNTALVYEGRKEVMVINEPGPIMTEEEVEGFLSFCRGAIDAPVISGVPGTLRARSYRRSLRNLHARQDRRLHRVSILGEPIKVLNTDELSALGAATTRGAREGIRILPTASRSAEAGYPALINGGMGRCH